LYQSVQDYLKRLPLSGYDDTPPERAMRLERHLARKAVFFDLVNALDRTGDNNLREAVEAVLFNYGVQQIGEIGKEISYNVHIHETQTSGLLPGDFVTVVKPARVMGTQDDYVVIKKGLVDQNHEGGDRE
jgi:hypothetical protein